MSERKAPTRALRADEYLDTERGLICCARCRTPRQKVVSIMGKTLVPDVLCRCRQKQQEEEQAKQKRREQMMRVQSLKAHGLQDRALRDYNFKNDDGRNPEIDRARAYADHFEEMEKNSMGLLLWGSVGTGKTFFAGCIANALIEKGVPVLMTNFSRALNALSGLYSDERNRYINSFNNYRLLIIDDLGIERSTDFALEQVYQIIDSRYKSKKPLIITTNLTLKELKNPGNLAYQRIYDRILERCVPVLINERNFRAENAEKQMASARAVLCT